MTYKDDMKQGKTTLWAILITISLIFLFRACASLEKEATQEHVKVISGDAMFEGHKWGVKLMRVDSETKIFKVWHSNKCEHNYPFGITSFTEQGAAVEAWFNAKRMGVLPERFDNKEIQ